MSAMIEVEGQFYIPATSSGADLSTRVLKDGETFAIFDRHGDIRPLGFENEGLFHEGTRFISRLKLEMEGKTPLLLSSQVREENDFLIADQTNPDIGSSNSPSIKSGTIHLARTIFLLEGECFIRLEISNFGLNTVAFNLSYAYEADFVDVFELRGMSRPSHGQMLPPEVSGNSVILSYEGLDHVPRETQLFFSRPATEINGDRAVFALQLAPAERTTCDLRIGCRTGTQIERHEPVEAAFEKRRHKSVRYGSSSALIKAGDPQFNDWLRQSRADLHMLLTDTPHGLYPFAGIPWYSCVFGRDGIITALETLWSEPDIARGVLGYLAAYQATESNAAKDSEPGKILHEQRRGEMAALNEIPFGNYYGTIDATPLFVVLAGRYFERTADVEFIGKLWPHIERAFEWIDSYGDCDGDGFVEYQRRTDRGLSNQGWKDSEDSIFHTDGDLASAPIALCEVQGYVFEAKLLGARMAAALGHHQKSDNLQNAAARLKDHFQKAFWCDEIGMYALALDGEKRQCRVRSSNAGHALFSGIAAPAHAERIGKNFLDGNFFSGWGIRTIAAGESRYNPMSYHNGSIWPHDNAIIASGLARYGMKEAALRILGSLFDASRFMDLNRLPELYCGFPRRRGEGPTHYPVACNPQAWASASIFLVLESVLGLRLDASAGRVVFENPLLSESLSSLEIKNLTLPSGSADVVLHRDGETAAIKVTKRTGRIEVVVIS